MAGNGPAWVPVGLDGLNLAEAREGSRDLPARVVGGRSWEVELPGPGDHTFEVRLLAPVRSTADGRRVDLPTPLAASTRVEIKVGSKVVDASTGPIEPVAVIPDEAGQGARLVARLSPRGRVELSWRERSDPAVQLPALLSAQGEIAVEVERGVIRTQGSWVVSAIRGAESRLGIGLSPGEEVLDVAVDGRPVLFETRKDGDRSVLVVPLAEPLRTNASRALLINTRRPIASSGTARVAIQGYPFDQARVQTGVLAIARNGPIFVNPTPGRGLRRIDPRTELPESLRVRPNTDLAFEFNDQPFELTMGVEPAPPRLLVENRTTLILDARSARVETRLNCRPSQGRTFELSSLIPEGLEFEGAGPPDVVSSTQLAPLSPDAAARVLTINLTLPAREAESFVVVLKGRAALDTSKPVAIPLFQPSADGPAGGRFALVTDRSLSAEFDRGGGTRFPLPGRLGRPAERLGLARPEARARPRIDLAPVRGEASHAPAPLDGPTPVDPPRVDLRGDPRPDRGRRRRRGRGRGRLRFREQDRPGPSPRGPRELVGGRGGTGRPRIDRHRTGRDPAIPPEIREGIHRRLPAPDPLPGRPGRADEPRSRHPGRVESDPIPGRDILGADHPGLGRAWDRDPRGQARLDDRPGLGRAPPAWSLPSSTTGPGPSRSSPASPLGWPCQTPWSPGSESGRSSVPRGALRPRPVSRSRPGKAPSPSACPPAPDGFGPGPPAGT